MIIRKKIMVLLAVVIMAFSVSPFVLAATPEPAGNAQTQSGDTQMGGAAGTQVTIAPAGTSQNTASELVNKKYLTKGGAIFWFAFTVVLNSVLSFWIGNRFYKMSKKDNHMAAEIRALRRDVEEKFVKSVGGFSEQEIDINNLNESLAMDDEGIKPVERQIEYRETGTEDEERFRRWEAAQSAPRSERARQQSKAKSAVSEELEEDFEDVRKIRRKNYQPKRNMRSDDFLHNENDMSDLGETQEIKVKGDGVRSKAKEILGDIFPFKED